MYGESIFFNYGQKYDIPFTIVRYHNVYGPRMGFMHIVPEMFVKITENEIVDVASPLHTRAMCYIDDAVEMTILACESCNTNGEILNIGNQEQEISVRELVSTISKVLQKQVEFNEIEDTPGSPSRRCPDISKIKNLTGFSPKVCLFDGISKTYDWYKSRLHTRHE
jgi:nucleoside-diphosphate-sugar epimerase